MSIFWIVSGLGLAIAIFRAMSNAPMWSDDWFEFFMTVACGALLGLFVCFTASGIIEETDDLWYWKPINQYEIEKCVETVSNYDIKYYDPDMGYMETSLPKKNCYINPLPAGEDAYVIVKAWRIENPTIDKLVWQLTEKYAYSIFIPEGGN